MASYSSCCAPVTKFLRISVQRVRLCGLASFRRCESRSDSPTVIALLLIAIFATCARGEETDSQPDYQTKSLQGEVVWMADALKEQFGVRTVAEARDRLLALQTEEGELYPIIEDVRGRAFRRDERLRDRKLELLVRQYEGSPMIQLVRMYALKEDGKYELDYWCDICAIALFELKPCDCCQGPLELRERKVE